MASARRCPAALAVLLLLAAGARARRWAPADLEAPLHSDKRGVCTAGYGPSYVCDPSGLVSREQRRALDRAMAVLERAQPADAAYNPLKTCGGGLEVRATVIRYMAANDAPSASVAAERMAKTLLTDWRLGECGVLVFVSMGDRRMYIATGPSATKLLPKSKVRSIIADMKQYLQRGDPARGLLTAVHDIERIARPASSHHAHDGSEGDGSAQSSSSHLWGWELTVTVILAAVAIVLAVRNGKGGAERTKLNAIMKPDHCSLCLQPFFQSTRAVGSSPSSSSSNEDGSLLPDDALRLPCGHMFHRTQKCWLGWTESQGSEACPLCSATEGASSAVEVQNVERQFKLERIRAVYPELDDVASREVERRQKAIQREHRRLSRQQRLAEERARYAAAPADLRSQEYHSGGPGVWGVLGAGAAGAAIGSALSGIGRNQQNYGGTNQSFFGGNVGGTGGSWGGQNVSNNQGGGWGGGFGSGASDFIGGGGGGWGGGSDSNIGGDGGGF